MSEQLDRRAADRRVLAERLATIATSKGPIAETQAATLVVLTAAVLHLAEVLDQRGEDIEGSIDNVASRVSDIDDGLGKLRNR